MKHLRETFTDEEFERLRKAKERSGKNWHEFILMFSTDESTALAKEIKEEMTNGWSDLEKSRFNNFLEEEIKPYWPTLCAFLVTNLGKELTELCDKAGRGKK